jgi:hypothetical protein
MPKHLAAKASWEAANVLMQSHGSTGPERKKPLQAKPVAVFLVFRPDLVAGAGFEPATFGYEAEKISMLFCSVVCADLA